MDMDMDIFFVKPDLLVRHFYNRFGPDLAQLAFGESSSIMLALSGTLCVVVDLGIGCICC